MQLAGRVSSIGALHSTISTWINATRTLKLPSHRIALPVHYLLYSLYLVSLPEGSSF